MLWLVGIYIFSLAFLLVTAFWVTDPFTSKVKPSFTLANFEAIITTPAYLSTSFRTLGIAIAVTLICAAIAIPLGIFMAKIASPRNRELLVIAITMPLWAGYLVKVLAMRITFTEDGLFNWLMNPFGISGPGFSIPTVILTLCYLWFPYMAMPVYTAVRQIPDNLFDAASDLGAGNWLTVRSVVLPLIVPALIAGSIFTFSLSLGDYITAQIVGGKVTMLGNIVQTTYVTNLPFAAAVATIPVIIVLLYLLAVRRSGALDNL